VVSCAGAIFAAGAAISATPAVQGDANCDGAVNPADALSVLLSQIGADGVDMECAQLGGNVDCDGDAEESDALLLLEHAAFAPETAAAGAGCTPIGEPLPTPSPSNSGPPSVSPSPTTSPTAPPTPTPTQTPTPTPTQTPTDTPTITPTPTMTPTETVTLTPTPTATPWPLGYEMTLLPADAGLDKLTNVVPIPGDSGRAVITTEGGMIWIVELDDDRARELIADLSAVVRDKKPIPSGTPRETDEGLLSFAFDPDDPSIVYINYSTPPDGTYQGVPGPSAVRSRISRFELVSGQLTNEETILEVYQPWEWHNASQLVFGPDGMLYIGSGDGGLNSAMGQTLDDLWGAILRIDVHQTASPSPYAVPTDNPFFDGDGSNRDEVWAYGLRHPWRFTFDGGQMWIGDVGEGKFEEINIGEAGANYGWNWMEGHACFKPAGPTTTPLPCDTSAYETPRAGYDHNAGCAISAGHVYHGSAMPELEGYLIYGDFCSGRVWALNTADEDSDPVLLADTDLHFVSWAVDGNGELIAVNYTRPPTFDGVPGVYRLEHAP
jgi:glucose/arabinose dehydrogenase